MKIFIGRLFFVFFALFFLIKCEKSADDQIKELYKYYISGKLRDRAENFLESPYPEVKSRLAYILTAEADTCYLRILKKLINDKITSVRLAAAYSLGYINSFESRKILFERFNTEWDYDIKIEIMRSIGKIGTEADLRYLVLENYPGDDFMFESLYYFFARGIYTEGRINFLINAIINGSYNEKIMALKVLSNARIPRISFDLRRTFNELLNYNFNLFFPLIAPIAVKFNQIDDNIIETIISSGDKNDLIYFMRFIDSYRDYKKFWNYCLESNDDLLKSKAIYYLSKNCQDIDSELVSKVENIFNSSTSLDVRLSSIQFLASVYPDSSLIRMYNEVYGQKCLPHFLYGLSLRNDSLGILFFEKVSDSVRNRTKYLSYQLLMDYMIKDSCNHEIFSKYLISGLKDANPIINLIALKSIGECNYYNNELTPILLYLLDKYLNSAKNFLFLTTLSDISDFISASAMFSINKKLFKEGFGLSPKDIEKVFNNRAIVKNINNKKRYFYVKVKTSKGELIIRCEREFTPISTNFFIDSIKKGVYNNSFIRIDNDDMIIFGDTTYVDYTFPERIIKTEHSPILFAKYSVGLLNYNNMYQSHQFFVTLSDNAKFDLNYTRIGKIVKGQEFLNRLNNYDKIEKIEILN